MACFDRHRSKNQTPVFREYYICFGRKNKRGWYVIFQDRPMLAISFKRSRRELPINVAVSTLKNYQNTCFYRFRFNIQNRYSIPYNGCFVYTKPKAYLS